ncbi:hypothetical protein ACH3XW_0750 [Acanthocheilonema viteae]
MSTIVCGMCGRQFETVKGWRNHTSTSRIETKLVDFVPAVGEATLTRSCGERRGFKLPLHSRPMIPPGLPHAADLLLPVSVSILGSPKYSKRKSSQQ